MSDIEFERRMNDQFAKNLFFFLNKYQYTQAAFAKQMNVALQLCQIGVTG